MGNQEKDNKQTTNFLILVAIAVAILFLTDAFKKEDKWSLIVGTEKDDLSVVNLDDYSDRTQCLNAGNFYLQQQGGNYTYFECGQDCGFSNTGNSVICKITCDNTGCSD